MNEVSRASRVAVAVFIIFKRKLVKLLDYGRRRSRREYQVCKEVRSTLWVPDVPI